MDEEAQIYRYYARPNEIRKRILAQTGHSWEQAAEIDRLERRENTFLDLMEVRRLNAGELRDLADVQEELRLVQQAQQARAYAPVAA